MGERTEWVERRNAMRFDWSEAVEAMAQVKVEGSEAGLIVDTSAINTHGEYWPTRTLLVADPEGGWYHEGTNQSAPLVEWLWTMTLSAIDDPFNPELKLSAAGGSPTESEET